MSARPPEPVRKRVFLVSEGIKTHRKATVHHHVATVPVTIGGEHYWSFEYQCFETGVRRRFGLADRTEIGRAELDAEIEREGN